MLIIVSFESSIFAQDSLKANDSVTSRDSLSSQEINKFNFSQLFHESGLLIKQPIRWKGHDWIKFGAVVAVTFAVMQEDQKIRDIALKNPKYSKSFPMEVGNQWGGFFFGPLLALTLYTTGSLSDSYKTKKIGFEIAQGILYSEAISFVSKGCIGRSRPFTNQGASAYHPFTFFDSPSNSFPAGHVDAAFALSTVLSKNAGSGFLKVLAYVPAALTVTARIIQDAHWASDVVIGGAIGYFVGTWVVNIHEKKDSRIQLSGLYPLSVKISLN
jgi:hypothetical protein